MKVYTKAVLGLLLFASIHLSCKREFEKPRWDTQILAPLVKSKLTISNIVKDTTQLETESDQSISLVSRQQIFTYTIDSLVSLEAPQYKKTVKLGSLVLSNQTITRKISLGEIAKQLRADGNPLGNQIILAHKLGFPFAFPGANNITTGPINIDIKQFFKTADLVTGEMSITVKNGLPLTISSVQFSLDNITPPSVITSQTFTNIAPNGTRTTTEDLSGRTIGSILEASVDDMDIASGTVSIDTSDAIFVTLSIKNITVSSATAIFPEQEVVNETANVELVGLNNVELVQTIIRQGSVRANVYSTAEDTVRFTYEIPAAIKKGKSFSFEAVVPPAPPNGTSHAIFNTDFSGYTLDLTGTDGTMYNTFYNVLKGKIRYTGKLVNLSLDDSLDITLTLVDPKPTYVKGYLGEDGLTVGPGSVDVDIFKNISASVLDFSSASINIVFENSLGIPATASLDNLVAYNSKTGVNLALTGTPISQTFPIAAATEGGGFPISAKSTIDLSTGSNATNVLNILPDRFTYKGDFQFNPLGNNGQHTDFAYSGVDLKAYLDIKIPLSIIASNLVLADTSSFSIPGLKTSGFQDGRFNLVVLNGFPIDVKVDMRFLDKNGFQVDSIITANIIRAAEIDGSGKVIEAKQTIIPFKLDPASVYNLTNRVTQVVCTARFDTQPSDTHIVLYDNYAIDFKLVGDMNIQVNSGK